jgi:hypothetical protein
MPILPKQTIVSNINSEILDNSRMMISPYDVRHNLSTTQLLVTILYIITSMVVKILRLGLILKLVMFTVVVIQL